MILYKINAKKMQNTPRNDKGAVIGKRVRRPKAEFVVPYINSLGAEKQLVLHPTKGWRSK